LLTGAATTVGLAARVACLAILAKTTLWQSGDSHEDSDGEGRQVRFQPDRPCPRRAGGGWLWSQPMVPCVSTPTKRFLQSGRLPPGAWGSRAYGPRSGPRVSISWPCAGRRLLTIWFPCRQRNIRAIGEVVPPAICASRRLKMTSRNLDPSSTVRVQFERGHMG
jgi:hypothetical protein